MKSLLLSALLILLLEVIAVCILVIGIYYGPAVGMISMVAAVIVTIGITYWHFKD